MAATHGQVCELRGRMKEWEDLTKWEQDHLVELFAKILVDDYQHRPPSCRFCLKGQLSVAEERRRLPSRETASMVA